MIARIWKGKTKVEYVEAYSAFMKARAIPDYKQADGFIKLTFLSRIDDAHAYFRLVTYWENLDVKDPEKAKYYPEDKKYLIDFPDTVTHYEVFAE
ncbi:hypothetical protein SAMN04488028_102163 [Reichenbachiella agariperforans]|uniref:Antibiotic biosynthesis monooxygenase n=1 Tax=Reichenbachiella agariperforans TaxID=156994 RepID=A0A1M6N9P6_REIAG|nr:hypothetical protein [Reichenbachiella agariperforans]SHJ92401.1 hypothetical protein SAMN04488028_102163 [Reichenbachiella agariperforans]